MDAGDDFDDTSRAQLLSTNNDIELSDVTDVQDDVAYEGDIPMGFVYFCSFLAGLSPLVSWNSIYLSQGYLQEFLGPKVLSVLGSCQNGPSLLILLILLVAAKRNWAVNLPYLMTLTMTLGTMMLGLSGLAVLYHVAGTGLKKDTWAILLIVIVNGICTGLSSGRGYALAAEFPTKATSYLVAGAGAGALSPAVILWILQKPVVPPENLFIVYSISCMIILFSIISFHVLSRTRAYSHYVVRKYEVMAKECPKPVVDKARNNPGFDDKIHGRAHASFVHLSIAAAYTMMLSISLLSVSTLITEYTISDITFFLITSYYIGDLVGRQAAVYLPLRGIWLALWVFIRTGFVPLIIAYAAHPFGGSDVLPLAVYFLLSFSNGFSLVSLNNYAQEVCGFELSNPCPVVASLMAAATQGGLVGGIVVSFGFYPIVDAL